MYTRFPEQLLFQVGTVYPLPLPPPSHSYHVIVHQISWAAPIRSRNGLSFTASSPQSSMRLYRQNPVLANSMVFSYLSSHLFNKVGGGGDLWPPFISVLDKYSTHMGIGQTCALRTHTFFVSVVWSEAYLHNWELYVYASIYANAETMCDIYNIQIQ